MEDTALQHFDPAGYLFDGEEQPSDRSALVGPLCIGITLIETLLVAWLVWG